MSVPIRYLVSDIDGTLVTRDKTLTPAAVDAVAEARAVGLAFTVISSRPPRGMAGVVERLGVSLPFAAFNGGNLVAPDMTVIRALRLDRTVAEAALGLLAQRRVDAWVFADGAWMVRDPKGARVQHERHTVGFDPVVVADFTAVVDRIDKIVAVSDDAAALSSLETEARAAWGATANIERSQSYYLDFTHPQANKGEAVRALAGMLGVGLAATAVIGDMTNDVAMFKVAGFSVVMGQSPPEVKAAADVVTRSNEDDGFAYAVRQFIVPRAAGRDA